MSMMSIYIYIIRIPSLIYYMILYVYITLYISYHNILCYLYYIYWAFLNWHSEIGRDLRINMKYDQPNKSINVFHRIPMFFFFSWLGLAVLEDMAYMPKLRTNRWPILGWLWWAQLGQQLSVTIQLGVVSIRQMLEKKCSHFAALKPWQECTR